MANSVREMIFQDIKSALQGISGPPSYNFRIDDKSVNVIHGTHGETYQEPYIYIYPASESVRMDSGEKGKTYKALSIQIEAWLKSEPKSEMNGAINKMLHDIEKALMIDPHRGGYAIDTRMVSNDVFIESIGSPRCGLVVSIEVDYQHWYNDPTDP